MKDYTPKKVFRTYLLSTSFTKEMKKSEKRKHADFKTRKTGGKRDLAASLVAIFKIQCLFAYVSP